jgi:hypothetical protein
MVLQEHLLTNARSRTPWSSKKNSAMEQARPDESETGLTELIVTSQGEHFLRRRVSSP